MKKKTFFTLSVIPMIAMICMLLTDNLSSSTHGDLLRSNIEAITNGEAGAGTCCPRKNDDCRLGSYLVTEHYACQTAR